MMQRDGVDPGALRVRQLIEELELPTPWDLQEFIDTIAEQRGKPIRLIPSPGWAGPGQPCGIWIGSSTEDLIMYDDTTSCYHVEQIILHELGHLLLEHNSNANLSDTLVIRELIPDIDPSSIDYVLGRTSYDDEQERQAELFASLMVIESRRGHTESKFLSTFLCD